MTNILGYKVTLDPQALPAFIAEVTERYDQLEAAIAPIERKIAELSQDWQPGEEWKPRPVAYWQEVSQALSALRSATGQCQALFSKGPEAPTIPIVFSALSITFRCGLHCIVECLDSAGMQLTAYRAVCTSCEVAHLNQRQHLLKALQRLAKETHGGITKARAELDKAPEKQRKILAPKKSPADQGTPHLHIVGDSQERGSGNESV